VLHGALFQNFLDSDAYRGRFPQAPVICISVSTSKTYHRLTTATVLGWVSAGGALAHRQYFAKMGLQVRYFMPRGSVAPLAFYFAATCSRTTLQLIGTISTMETFQKISRGSTTPTPQPPPCTVRRSARRTSRAP
jgi:hypothetical protein